MFGPRRRRGGTVAIFAAALDITLYEGRRVMLVHREIRAPEQPSIMYSKAASAEAYIQAPIACAGQGVPWRLTRRGPRCSDPASHFDND